MECYASLKAAETARAGAEAALAGPLAHADQIAAKLAEARRELAAVNTPGDDAPVTDQIAAEVRREAIAKVIARIEAQAREHANTVSPLQQALAKAAHTERLAKAKGALLLEASEDPLRHPWSRQTPGYGTWMACRWHSVIMRGDHGDPGAVLQRNHPGPRRAFQGRKARALAARPGERPERSRPRYCRLTEAGRSPV
jgi:hypothetical protein